ncbi:lipoate--protein ligase family protein [Candidatus Poribacteria bacterium]|nr:lipoate--protein ligase family protein [Candidatus Poribacteria bacterium]
MWRLILDGQCDPYTNMARDEAMLLVRINNDIPDTIRFYTWNKPSISLGYFQTAEKEILLENCNKYNIPIVRRITGGRAVFHDCEITYSIVAKEDNPYVSGNIKKAFFSIAKCLLDGLKFYGIEGELVSRMVSSNKKNNRNPVCFSSVSWYEIVINGKKIVGTAQTKKKGIILHQGSILINFETDNFIKYFKLPDKSRMELINFFKQNITGIEKVSGEQINIERLRECILYGFKKNWEDDFIKDNLTENELKLELDLYNNKYTNANWNIFRNY